eukprot:6518120-Alexandrium_andersonii.AAC.1
MLRIQNYPPLLYLSLSVVSGRGGSCGRPHSGGRSGRLRAVRANSLSARARARVESERERPTASTAKRLKREARGSDSE